MAWTTGSGPCRATTTRSSKSAAQKHRVPPGFLSLQARRLATGIHPLDRQQHLGPGHQRRGAGLRLDGQPQPQRLTCRSPTATTRRSAAGRPRWCWARSPTRHLFKPDHRQGAAGRSLWRLHGRRRARAVHGPPLSARVLEPHGVRQRADRAPGGHVRADARRGRLSLDAARSTCWPATTNGPRRSWPRSDPTATCGYRLVQLHRAAQSHARSASRPAKGPPTKPTCATSSTAASIAWSTTGRTASTR